MDIARELHLRYEIDHPGRITRGKLIINPPSELSWSELPRIGDIEDYDRVNLMPEMEIVAQDADAPTSGSSNDSSYCIIS